MLMAKCHAGPWHMATGAWLQHILSRSLLPLVTHSSVGSITLSTSGCSKMHVFCRLSGGFRSRGAQLHTLLIYASDLMCDKSESRS